MWERFLWTRAFGFDRKYPPTYLGEGGERDAFETLMGVLRSRLVGMGLGAEEEMRRWEGPEHWAALRGWWGALGYPGGYAPVVGELLPHKRRGNPGAVRRRRVQEHTRTS